jgi:N-acetylglucosaminyl-diphospho-decaprenol L-rhamnosyltransferase
MFPAVTVAVVSWNGRDHLPACLRSLEPDASVGRAEVWVVDNASSDGSADLVEREFPWVELVRSHSNLGYGPAVNLIAERTSSRWIAACNQDIELEPGAIESLLAAGAAHPDAGILAPRLIRPDGSTQVSARPLPTLGFTLLSSLGLAGVSRRYAERRCLEPYFDPDRARDVPWALGAFLLIRREAFDAVGGFDPEQWLHAEDLSLGWRMSDGGWSTRYEPRARARHRESTATGSAFGDELSAHWTAATYAWLARYRGPVRARATAALNLVGALGRYALATTASWIRPRRFTAARGFWRRWARQHADALRAPRSTPASRAWRRGQAPGGD